MLDQNFGHKELYEVVLRAKTPMQFGDRYIEADEPVLYFDNVQMSLLSEQSRPIFARGGWGNMPRVIWEERSEVQFQMTEGVMSSVGMSILLSANVLQRKEDEPLYVHMKEGPLTPIVDLTGDKETVSISLKHQIVPYPIKKTFIFEYGRKAIQEKIYGKSENTVNGFGSPITELKLYQDKNCNTPAKSNVNYVVDYYYEYEKDNKALIYSLEKERFNALFSLEAKFYSKDENEGRNYTNVLYMPKVRVVSSINLRLGERADPTVATFNIIGMPENYQDRRNLICEITRLDYDAENADI